MGLLTGLVLLPLAPVRGVAWLARQVQTQAETELDHRESIVDRLAAVAREREAGGISEAEAAALEEEILDELEW